METPPDSRLTGDYAGESLDLVRARLSLFRAVNQAAHISGLTFLPLLLACRVHGSEGVRPVSVSSPLPGLAEAWTVEDARDASLIGARSRGHVSEGGSAGRHGLPLTSLPTVSRGRPRVGPGSVPGRSREPSVPARHEVSFDPVGAARRVRWRWGFHRAGRRTLPAGRSRCRAPGELCRRRDRLRCTEEPVVRLPLPPSSGRRRASYQVKQDSTVGQLPRNML